MIAIAILTAPGPRFAAHASGAAAEYSVSVTPGAQSVVAGGSVAYHVTVTSHNGFSGNVSYAAGAGFYPAGLVVTQNPMCPIPVPANGSGQATITAATATSTPPARLTITVSFQSAGVLRDAQVTLTISSPAVPQPPDTAGGPVGR